MFEFKEEEKEKGKKKTKKKEEEQILLSFELNARTWIQWDEVLRFALTRVAVLFPAPAV